MSSPPDKNILREWKGSAPYWAKHAGVVRSMFAPITSALIDAAAIDRNASVLDVAGGSGEPSITIAERVGPLGLVNYTDAVAEMVVAARSEARRRRLNSIEFTRCVGEALPFSSDTFDAVVCRLGVMLFSEPGAAISEMLRVVKPGGRVALAVWGARDSNPFFQIAADVVSRYIESPPDDPQAPGAFRFAKPGDLARVVNSTKTVEVTERLFRFTLEAPLTPNQFWEVRSELSDTLRAKTAGLSSEQGLRVAREVEEAARPFCESGVMRLPAEVLIVSATRKVT